MPRERKPSAKVAFMEASNAEWDNRQEHLEATKTERKSAKSKPASKSKGGKRPLSAYMHFSKAMRGAVKEEYPDASFGEIGRILGSWWADAAATERAKYEQMSQDEKDAYGSGGSGSGSAPKKRAARPASKLSYFDMSKAAIVALKNRKGSSHNAIEAFIKENYPDVDFKRHLLNKALKTASDNGKLVRHGNSFKVKK